MVKSRAKRVVVGEESTTEDVPTSKEVPLKGSAKKRSTKTKISKPRHFILTDISAIQVILSASIRTNNKVIVIDGDPSTQADALSQTVIPSGDDDDIPISEIIQEKSKRATYFLDDHKTQVKCWPNMIDVTTNGVLPAISTPKACCWWDRTPFTTRPIGCPLRYVVATGTDKARFDEKLAIAGIKSDASDLFETEGVFCSFPCCKAYILSQRSARYNESAALLAQLFSTFYNRPPDYPIAPSWKLLDSYGGHLTIQQFRASFGKLEYEETINMRRPYMFCTSSYITEKRIKLFRGGTHH